MDPLQRARQRTDWLGQCLDGAAFELTPASEDASFRSYWRVRTAKGSLILMDAPPANEDCRPFVEVTRMLRDAGVNAPQIHAQDLTNGLLLLEDLGVSAYARMLSDKTAPALYQDAFDALAIMQKIDCGNLPVYDETLLRSELALFHDWLMLRHLKLTPGPAFERQWECLQQVLIQNALSQPTVFVHRDYHCRNLMVCPDHNPGVIDYQDAVQGPITYDLVSLLRDCYVRWPAPRVAAWSERFRQRAIAAGHTHADTGTWRRWFDLMGVQRHLKASGIFCRLWHRDGKPGFLKSIPRGLGYIREIAPLYPELAELELLLAEVLPRLEAARP